MSQVGDLILCEMRRFGRWALALALIHYVAIWLLHSMIGVVSPPWQLGFFAAVVYGLGAICFGVLQMGSWSRPNQWQYLMYRPLSVRGLLSSCLLAGVLIIIIVIAAPLLLFLSLPETLLGDIVSAAHYWTVLYATLVAVLCYMAAVLAVLHPSRIAWFALLFPIPFLSPQASGAALWIPPLAAALWLLCAIAVTFKPSLDARIETPVGLAATVVPIQFGLFVLVAFALPIVFETAQYAFGTHPFQGARPGSVIQVTRELSDAELFDYGLAELDLAQRDYYSRQLALGDFYRLGQSVSEHRASLGFSQLSVAHGNQRLIDSTNDTIWKIDSAARAFETVPQKAGEVRRWLGRTAIRTSESDLTDEDRFDSIPAVYDNRFVATRTDVYEYDEIDQSMRLRIQLDETDSIESELERFGSVLILLSEGGLNIIDANQFSRSDKVVAPLASVPWPRDIGHLYQARMTELVDGYLFALVFQEQAKGGGEEFVFRVSADGAFTELGHRELLADANDFILYSDALASPIYSAVYTLLKDRDLGPLAGMPKSALWLMGALTMICALIAGVVSFSAAQPRTRKACWVMFVGLGGLPALVTFFCLGGWQPPSRSRSPRATVREGLANETGRVGRVAP